MRCTIRPKPVTGESLTSYIMRIAVINCLSFIDVWRHFNSFFQRPHMKDAIQLDIHHKRVVSMKNITSIIGLQNDQLETMSLSLLHEKYYGDVDIGLHNRDFMMRLFNTKTRRFCPECINESAAYKLIWQISEITHCLEHKIELINTCSHCQKEQPYVWGNMVFKKCNFCYSDLKVGKTNQNAILIEYSKQERVLHDWNYTLSPKKSIIPKLNNDNKLSMALSFLYLHKNTNNKVLEVYEFGILSRYVRGISDPKGITFPLLLKVIRTLDISLDEYSSIDISEQEIKGLREPENPQKEKVIGVCLAPWCKSFGNSKQMSLTSFSSPKLFINKRYYTDIRICTDCSLRYGINKGSGIWEECDQIIDIGFNKIRPLINELRSINSIKVKLKMSQYNAQRYIGYLCYYRLISNEAFVKHVTFNTSNELDLITCFEKLVQLGKSMFHNSRYNFGWSGIQYWYYHSIPDVQRYLYIELKRKGGPSKEFHRSDELKALVNQELKRSSQNGKPINPEIIMQLAGCNRTTLTRYKLHNKIKQAEFEQELQMKSSFYENINRFVETANSNGVKFTYDDAFEYIGKSKKWIKRRFPDLLSHIEKLREENRKIVDQFRADEIFEKAKEIIPKMLAKGEPPFIRVIRDELKKLGEQYFLLEHNKDLSKKVKELLEQVYT